MIQTYEEHCFSFHEAPLKFEAGTPHIAGAIGLGEAVAYVQQFVDREHYITLLTRYAEDRLRELPGVRVLGPKYRRPRGPLFSLIVDGAHVSDLGYLLDSNGVAVRTGHLCAQAAMRRWNVSHVLRLSLGIYSNQEDIDRFCSLFREHYALLTN